MMDLLVQVTTAYKISPAGHVLQPYGESGLLPYKPSTPIGALDTWTVHIVPKHQSLQNPAHKISLKQVIQPFEQTFRFQVNLPRNQLYVTRVNGRTTMGEILEQACREKGLDINKYALKHPKQLDGVVLCEELSVAEYGHNQVSMVSNRTLPPSSVSSDDILAMHKYSNSNKSCESSSRSLSPDSSVSPRQPVQPCRPLRKRRPAPKPPAVKPPPQQSSLPKQSTSLSNKQESTGSSNGPVICHSRTSSDSSGYHEASVLSESPDSNNSSSLPDSLPRRSKLPTSHLHVQTHTDSKQKLSRSLSNIHQASTSTALVNGINAESKMKSAQSTSSLAPSRKKKPAPPPPVVFSIAEEREETLSTASRTSKTLPAGTRLQDCQSSSSSTSLTPTSVQPVEMPVVEPSELKPVVPSHSTNPNSITADCVDTRRDESDDVIVENGSDSSSLVTRSETDRIEAEIERMFEQATREHVSLESGVDLGESPERLPSPPSQPINDKSQVEVADDDPFMDWEYKLPAPPTFRDEMTSPPLTEYSTMIGGNINQSHLLFESTNNKSNTAALISELSAAIVQKTNILRSHSTTQMDMEEANPSGLDNFHITTYKGKEEEKRCVRGVQPAVLTLCSESEETSTISSGTRQETSSTGTTCEQDKTESKEEEAEDEEEEQKLGWY
ncbi:hypothetical protein O3M35_001522 [Rhynocoris fuscipes]|uniref:RBD domain-containing protein n=1 Tax=Rhynocoris fuscipes TaxID=488301 RepID=A0AAW1CTS3_9HEMI